MHSGSQEQLRTTFPAFLRNEPIPTACLPRGPPGRQPLRGHSQPVVSPPGCTYLILCSPNPASHLKSRPLTQARRVWLAPHGSCLSYTLILATWVRLTPDSVGTAATTLPVQTSLPSLTGDSLDGRARWALTVVCSFFCRSSGGHGCPLGPGRVLGALVLGDGRLKPTCSPSLCVPNSREAEDCLNPALNTDPPNAFLNCESQMQSGRETARRSFRMRKISTCASARTGAPDQCCGQNGAVPSPHTPSGLE